MARIAALLTVALLAAAPAAAPAAPAVTSRQERTPLQQAPAPTQDQLGGTPLPTQTQPQPTQVDDGSISGREVLLIAAGMVALFGGIWLVISRDAKRATAGRLPSGDSGLGGSATRAARRGRRLSAAERRRRKRGRATK